MLFGGAESMPGNEYGERIHNFFGQEGLSQDQHQSQVVDGSWSSFSSGLVGNLRQVDTSLIANLKSYSTQQPVDPERGKSENSQHGLNFTQQPIRSEYSRSLLQEHQQFSNGYIHGNLVLQTMPNEANFLGVDVETSRDKLSVKGFPPDFHRFEMGESPVNYDFLGGQQQLNSQLPGVLQPLPRQQMTFNDMQLLKQQVMVKQMHEYQMQQQLQKQQLETRQLNSLNSHSVSGSRTSDNQSHPLINGIPLQDASSHCWQPDIMTGNTNWMHRGISPIVQGSSNGLVIPPEHGQSQQFEPSLYGIPVGGTSAPQNSFSFVKMNRLAMQHGSANKSSSLTNQPTSFPNQSDSHMLPRSTYQEKLLFSNTSVPGSNNRPKFESLQQDESHEGNISVQEKFGQMEGSCLSEKSYMKAPESITAMPKSTTLDPTEEKILFGSDDNLWDAFGNSTDMSLTGNLMSSSSDLYDACPSLQSGSWSALMQSAVAETSSDDAGIQEWGSKQQSVWANNNTAPHANSHTDNRAQVSGFKAVNTLSERIHSDSTQTAVQHFYNIRNKVSDHGLLEKPKAQHSQIAGNIFHSSSSGIDGQNNPCSIRKNESIEDRLGIWKATSDPNLAALKEQNNHFTQNLQMQRSSYGAGNDSSAPRDVQGNMQQHLDNNSVKSIQILESYVSTNAGSNEMVNARDLSMLPGRKETQSGHVGNRISISHKFQYHPMGNIDVNDEPCREKVSHLPSTLEQVSVGCGQSKSLGQPAVNKRTESGHVSQSDLNCTTEAFKGMGPDNSPASSRQTMLELLHKVDQSQENSLTANVSRILEATPSAEYGGPFRHSQSSASQGFSLQLAPPTQLALSPDNVQFSQNSLQPLNSLYTAPEKRGTTRSMLTLWASNQSSPQKSTYQGESNITSGFPFSRGHHQNLLMPVATRQSAANHSGSMVNMHELQSKDMNAKQTSDVASMFSKIVQCNLQTFDRSLPSNNLPKDSLRHDEHMAGSGEGDAPKMTVKRVEDSAVDPQKLAPKGEQHSPSRSDGLVRDGLNHKESANHMLHFGQTVSPSFSNKNHTASGGADHQQISPQMAPSWYGQYGTFKNGLMQSANDTGRFTRLKVQQSSNAGSLVDGSHSVQSSKQLNTVEPGYVVRMQQMPGSAPGADTLSYESLPHVAADKLLKVDKPKRRKTATSKLLSWNKEVMQGPQRLKTLREAEVDWVRATTRFAEKVEFETLLEDGPPVRSKRRLIYTTQLMQQLFRPSPARVISLVANSNYDFVAYTAARAALGVACSSTSTDRSELFLPPNNSSPLSERSKTEKISDQYISKSAEDFISRTRNLKTDFAGLENGTTISDLRVEVQDLEKFAVINRFARFHPSSSSINRTVSSLRLNPQRYVIIAPMPQNIPDRLVRILRTVKASIVEKPEISY